MKTGMSLRSICNFAYLLSHPIGTTKISFMTRPVRNTNNYYPALSLFLLTLLLGLLFSINIYAQPVPCGPVPDMTTTCIDACVICDIDGYTGINDDTEVGQAPPGFCTNTVHHMQWIAFIAGSTNLTITVTPSNCDDGEGLEVGIYESLDCSTFNRVSNCDGDIQEGEIGTFTNTQPLVIGQYYYFVMDGNNGDICNYTIQVTNGSTMVPPLPPAEAVEGPVQICQSELASYFIPAIVGANFYKWTLDGQPVANGRAATLAFPTVGLHELCVTAFNVCDTVAPACKTVEVYASPITPLTQEICSGDCVAVFDTMICSPGNYPFHFTTVHGCDSTVLVSVVVLLKITVDLQASICSTDSLYVGDTWYFPPGQYVEQQISYNGCDSVINLTLKAIICEITGNIVAQPILCHGDQTGTLTFSVQQGTPPFTYTWQRFGSLLTGSGNLTALNQAETIENLLPGTYLITMQDAFSNDVILTANITEPPAFSVYFEVPDVNGYGLACAGGQNGTLTAQAQGGTLGYTFAWNTGSTQASLSGLAAGDYLVTATDANGCKAVAATALEAPPPLVLSTVFTDPNCDGLNSGMASAQTVSGGVLPYQFSLSNADFTNNNTFIGLAAGHYTLTVMDANGCTVDTAATLTGIRIPTLDVGSDLEIELGYSQQLQVVVDLIPQTIVWTPNVGLSCATCLEPIASPYETTIYTLTVTSADGCPTADSLTVQVSKIRHIYVPNVFSPNDDGYNDDFTIFADKAVRQVKNLRVFSRWGELVFERTDFPPNDLYYGWDGSFRGKDLPAAVFAWSAEVEFLDGEVVEVEGDVAMVR